MLNRRQIDRYHREGYLLIEEAVTPELIAALRAAAGEIIDEFDVERHRTVFSTKDRDAGRDDYFFDSAESVHCFLEEDALDPDGELIRSKELSINKIGHALHDLVPAFTRFCRQPLLGRILRDIGLRAPLLWQTMYIFKQPQIGGEVRWHQDASYLISRPSTVVGMWVALEDSTVENGCLWVAPGWHRKPLKEIYEVDWSLRKGVLRELDGSPWPGPSDARALEVPKGSLVIFHDHLPHYSSRNRSPRSRHAFTMHFAEATSEWPAENWLQRPTLDPFPV